MTRLRSLVCSSAALSALLLSGLSLPATAAGTGLGDASPAGENAQCDGDSGYTYLQTGSSASRYRVPSNGVITGWQFGTPTVGAPTTVGFRLGRASGSGSDTTYSVVGASADVPVTSGVKVARAVRIRARAGDMLGLYVAGPLESSRCARGTGSPDDTALYVAGNLTSGPATDPAAFAGFQLAVAATLEPDADADGYGDVSQDRCPTEARTHAACPAPQTRAGKPRIAKKLVRGGRQVTVAFRASKPGGRFQCALDSATKFRACSSPYRKRLEVGKHVLRVRSIGANGKVETTPAVVRIRVRR
ncbi:hypothetical protein [Nocardioides sp. 503]|uniref:hypothetical protein n=1 Tax=Nocardioides sp. 503 TaxID=2508326 RepID=UPI00106F8BBE|nr:hypothetical protein [Nocardioides sp. 503]